MAAAKHYLTTLGGMSPADFANGKDRPQREELEGVIADAERA
ncbi:MAG TPA: hypothetical protein VEL76_32595 [Gemmataceae bacterium]|nr:hypothetical protein [Gemmataceae bacterium]